MTRGAAVAATAGAAVAVVAVFAAVLLARSGRGTAVPAVTAVTATTSTTPPAAGLHGGDVVAPVALDAATQAVLDAELARAREAASRYPTAAAAKAAGYYRGVAYESGVGTHWVRFESIDGRLDPGDPEMLLFASDAEDAPLVGLTYYVYDSRGAPEGFAGDNDHWHRHPSVCVGSEAVHTEPGDATLAGCGARRGLNGWMLHAWVAPGYENPDGVFATRNPILP